MADVAGILADTDHRLVGGMAVVFHRERLRLETRLRATRDAEFGVAPLVLREGRVISRLAEIGYVHVSGCTWTRMLENGIEAAVDLLVPTYRTRARSSVQIGQINTTEVGGLAEALRRTPVTVAARVELRSGGEPLEFLVDLPDVCSMLAIKAHARSARDTMTDVFDILTCMEAIVTEGRVEEFRTSHIFAPARQMLAGDAPGRSVSTASALGVLAEHSFDPEMTVVRYQSLTRLLTGA